jgi:hypothetical protein
MPASKSINSRRSAHSSAEAPLRKRPAATGQHSPRDAEPKAEPELVAANSVVIEQAVPTGDTTFSPPTPEPIHHTPSTIAATWIRLSDSRSRLRQGFGSIRERAKEAVRKPRDPQSDGFYWYEKEWEERFWARRTGLTPRVLLTFALVLVVSLFVLLIAARAATRTDLPAARTSSGSNADPIIIQHEDYWDPAIPGGPSYAVGVWVSDPSPAASGVEEVYVEVSRNPDGPTVEPVANVPVKITSKNGVARGGLKTDTTGLAVFTFFYGSVPGTPVSLTATAIINGHSYQSTTDFVTS